MYNYQYSGVKHFIIVKDIRVSTIDDDTLLTFSDLKKANKRLITNVLFSLRKGNNVYFWYNYEYRIDCLLLVQIS